MLFLALAGLFSLSQILPQDQKEFRVLPLLQYIEKVFTTEIQATQTYFGSKKDIDKERLLMTSKHFQMVTDSLSGLISGTDFQQKVIDILRVHQTFDQYLNLEIERIVHEPNYDAMSGLRQQDSLIATINQTIRTAREGHLVSLGTALAKYNQRMSNAMETGFLILLLALAIGSVVAFLLAKTFVKPIRALQAGTHKVGEGLYETVPVTTKDEIADLTIAFNLMSEKLKQLDEMRMQMMSEISHEMRTPLQVIKAGCYSIVHTKDGAPLTERQRDAVGMIHQATNRINNFVNSFLDIAKMEAGLMKFNFEQLDLAGLFTPLVQEAQLIAQTRQIDLEFQAEEVPPMMIDKDRLSQAFSNLLSNALKYTADAGKITVRIKRVNDVINHRVGPKDCVRIDISDTGVGIPEEDLGKLFNKFYQAKNVPLVNEKGSGLGLALVKHVSEAHGGKVSVQSAVGAGSTFTVLLPLKK